jgi:hypothetical protein
MHGLSVAHATDGNKNSIAHRHPCRIAQFARTPPKHSLRMSNIALLQSSIVVPSPPRARQSSVTESVVLPPASRGASCPKSKSNRSNVGSTKCRQAGNPAHRATSSSFLAAPVVPTPSGRSHLAFGGGSNEIRGSPRLDPGLVPHFKLGASPQTDQEASMEQFVHQQNSVQTRFRIGASKEAPQRRPPETLPSVSPM